MNEAMKEVTAVVMAIVGVALLTVLVSRQNQTGSVITAASSGLSGLLSVAMGGAPSAMPGLAAG